LKLDLALSTLPRAAALACDQINDDVTYLRSVMPRAAASLLEYFIQT
jgi:hypothetical protein